jgi:hypothetical protein
MSTRLPQEMVAMARVEVTSVSYKSVMMHAIDRP